MTAVLVIQGPGLGPEGQRLLAGLAGMAGFQQVQPSTETALRAALAARRPAVLLMAGVWSSLGGAYATLALADASGAPRKVNVQALAPLLAPAPSAAGSAVLPILLADAAGPALAVAASQLLGKGLPGVLVLAPHGAAIADALAALAAAVQAWAHGATLADMAALLAPAWASQVHGDGGHRGVVAAAPQAAPGPLPAPAPAVAAVPAPVPTPMPATGSQAAPAPTPALSPAAQRVQQRRAAGQFDVFLCHNAADKPAVRALARQLLDRGILPWLDEWELPPGQPWQRLLEQQIGRIGSAAVCIGPAGFGRWHEMEMRGFIDEFNRRELPVISVLLLPPGAPNPDLPLFLRHFTWVDFRSAEPDPMDRLAWGVTGQRPAGLGE